MSALIPPPTATGESRQRAITGCCVPPAADGIAGGLSLPQCHSCYPVKLLWRYQIEARNLPRGGVVAVHHLGDADGLVGAFELHDGIDGGLDSAALDCFGRGQARGEPDS